MAKNEKSKAELYRDERKERIAKANKKNAKGLAAGKAVASIGKKILSVIVVIAIIAGIGYVVFQNTGLVKKNVTAATVGDDKISAVEFSYYYSQIYQNYSYQAQQYAQYGYNMGFDSSTSPDAQYTTDEDGNEITWAEQIKADALEQAQNIIACYNEAIKEGYELTEDDQAQIDETVESYQSSASENSYSLNAYLKASFCPGFNEKLFRELLEKQTIASSFYTQKQEELKDGISDDEIKKEYKDNQEKYDYVNLSYYFFDYETLTGEDGESDEDLKKRQTASNKKVDAAAKEAYGKVEDIKSFNAAVKADAATEDDEADATYVTALENTQYSTIESSINEEAAKWALSTDRKAGDKKLFTTDTGAYIVYIEKPAFTSHSVDVRHILVQFNAEDEDNVTDEEKKTAKEKAEDILKEWKSGEKTEESFAALATEKSEDTGSTENGGLYEKIRITDSYVEPFLDWSFDSSRKAGDTGIIETTYGYHVMYFSKDNVDDTDWENTIREDKGSTAFTEYNEALVAEDGDYKVVASDFWCNYIMKEFCKKITKNLAYSSSQS